MKNKSSFSRYRFFRSFLRKNVFNRKKAESGPIKQNDPKEALIWDWNEQNKNYRLKSILKKLLKIPCGSKGLTLTEICTLTLYGA